MDRTHGAKIKQQTAKICYRIHQKINWWCQKIVTKKIIILEKKVEKQS